MERERSADGLPEVTLTTDGSARGNPGPGGWAVLLEFILADGKVHEKLLADKAEGETTNNQMEVTAVAAGLEALKRPCRVHLRCDSQYVLDGIKKLQAGRAVDAKRKNSVAWERLAAALGDHILTLEWVEGHAGDERNEQVHEAAHAQANAAFELQQAQEASLVAEQQPWCIVVGKIKGSDHVAWRLAGGGQVRSGKVALGGESVHTATWQAVVQATEAAHELTQGSKPELEIRLNAEFIIKQVNHKNDIKEEKHKPFGARFEALRAHFGAVKGVYTKSDECQEQLSAGD